MHKLRKIIKEEVDKAVKAIIRESNEYRMVHYDELLGYLWLKPEFTGLGVDIFVDDGQAYVRDEHIPLLFVRNGYGRETVEFIPISLDENPEILDSSIQVKINSDVLNCIFYFIRENIGLLLDFANGAINAMKFRQMLKVPSFSVVKEGKSRINEMATLHKGDSNLPMDIWIDEGQLYQGHAPRIKFRASKEQRTTREFSSMTLTNPPRLENFPQKHDVSSKDIKILEKFVIDNLEALLLVSDGKMDYTTEFLPNMVKPQ